MDWPALEASTPTNVGGSGTGSERMVPGGTNRLDVLHETHALLAQWTQLVLEERFEPHERGQLDPLGSSAQVWLAFLARHATWLGGHPAAPEAAAELTSAAARVRGFVAPSGDRKIPVGACPVDECPGVVLAVLRDTDEGRPDLTCDLQPRLHRWGPGHYGHLAALLGTDGPERMTPTDLARWLTARFRRPISEGMVTGWIRRAEGDECGHDERDGTVDRVQMTMLYLARRARKAGAA